MDKTKQAVGVFDKLATEYQNKFMNVDVYGDTFDFFCEAVKKENAEILELACGPGNITRYLLNKRPDFKLLGIDLSPNMIALAKINNPAATFQLMDCREVGMIDKQYDAIMCGFCLPYLSKDETFALIGNASQLLSPGGILYLSTMEDDYSKSGFEKGSGGDEVFMHYYKAEDLVPLLKTNGFTILTTSRKEVTAPTGVRSTDLILIARKEIL